MALLAWCDAGILFAIVPTPLQAEQLHCFALSWLRASTVGEVRVMLKHNRKKEDVALLQCLARDVWCRAVSNCKTFSFPYSSWKANPYKL